MDREVDRRDMEENIYSELVFEEDLIDDGQSLSNYTKDHTDKNISNTKSEKESRMQVLETLPPNYVIFVPKNSWAGGEGIIACTLVPREMVTSMLSVNRDNTEKVKNKEARKNKPKNSKNNKEKLFTDIQIHFDNMTTADNECLEKASYDDEEEDKVNLKHVEYTKRDKGYTEPVQELRLEHNKVRSKKDKKKISFVS